MHSRLAGHVWAVRQRRLRAVRAAAGVAGCSCSHHALLQIRRCLAAPLLLDVRLHCRLHVGLTALEHVAGGESEQLQPAAHRGRLAACAALSKQAIHSSLQGGGAAGLKPNAWSPLAACRGLSECLPTQARRRPASSRMTGTCSKHFPRLRQVEQQRASAQAVTLSHRCITAWQGSAGGSQQRAHHIPRALIVDLQLRTGGQTT